MALTSSMMAPRSPGPSSNKNYQVIIHCPDQKIMVTASLPTEYVTEVNSVYEDTFSQGFAGLLDPGVNNVGKVTGKSFVTQFLTAQIWQGTSPMEFSLPLVFQVESDPAQDVLLPLMRLYSLVLPSAPIPDGFLQSPGPYLDIQQFLKVFESGKIKATASSIANDIGSSFQSSPASTQDSSSTSNSAGPLEKLGEFASGLPEKAVGAIAAGYDTTSQLAGAASSDLKKAIKNNVSLSIGRFEFFPHVVITGISRTTSVLPLIDGTMSRLEVTVGFKTLFVPTREDLPQMFPSFAPIASQLKTSG